MLGENLEEILAQYRKVITERVTASGQVCLTPCFVFAVSVEPTDGNAVFDAHLYDGHSVVSREKLTFTTQNASPIFCPCVPMFFRRGLYVYLETNVASITVVYLSVRE